MCQSNSRNCFFHGILIVTMLFVASSANSAGVSPPVYRFSVGGGKFSDTFQVGAALNLRAPSVLAIQNLEFAVGSIASRTSREAFVSLGPTWRWPLWNRRSYLDVGFSPTLLSGSSFDGRRLGGNLHFTSSLALGLKFGYRERTTISLRIQHTSNGGLNKPNPGLDMIGLNWSVGARE